ncbi:MAG: hypothetical protein ACRCXT_17965 [Paraclostridium sp.]
MPLDYLLESSLILKNISNISNVILEKDITKELEIDFVNGEFLARTQFDENKAIKMEINNNLRDVRLKNLFFKTILHELAHIVAESKYGYSEHGEMYVHTCRLLGVPFYDKIYVTDEENKILFGGK